jgi:hypothetical protein
VAAARSLLSTGLAKEVPAPNSDRRYAWRTGQHGEVLALRATALGLARVAEGASAAIASESMGTTGEAPAETGVPDGTDPEAPLTTLVPASEDMPSTAAPTGRGPLERPDDPNLGDDTAPASIQAAEGARKPAIAMKPAGRRVSLRQAAQGLLDAWDELACNNHNVIGALAGPIDNLRAALARKTLASAKIDPSLAPRNTKHAQVLAMLRRAGGASGPQIAEATGWALHTVRGFLAGLAKKQISVSVLERVRQVGPNKTGAKGSYTVYRIAETPMTAGVGSPQPHGEPELP